MNANNGAWLFVAIIMEAEYGLKQLFEALFTSNIKPKTINWFYRLFHLIILTGVLSLMFTTTYSWLIWPFLALISSFIGSLELLMEYFGEKCSGVLKRKMYIFHLVPFVFIVYFSIKTSQIINCKPGMLLQQLVIFFQTQIFTKTIANNGQIFTTGAIIILLAHPVNYLIRCLISKSEDRILPEFFYQKSKSAKKRVLKEVAVTNEEHNKLLNNIEVIKAGRIIGILERWLIMILILSGQFGSIGFVLAAKSIARFKNFEDKNFAEYYLMGTLYSVLFAILMSLFLLKAR